ncbi:MAG: hypothetical protein J0L84_00885 [Verrucomicrobia bacterium]|nr:hypothetical protein [Verrucomicrobiota bacterium]
MRFGTRAWIVCLLVGCGFAPILHAAEVFRVGGPFSLPQGTDQHGKELAFSSKEYRTVIFDTPGDSGAAEPPKDPQWFQNNQALMVVNISGFSGFKRRIARSRMESKPFRILVMEDADLAARFPRKEGTLTVIRVDEQGLITAITFAAPGKELQEAVAAPAK